MLIKSKFRIAAGSDETVELPSGLAVGAFIAPVAVVATEVVGPENTVNRNAVRFVDRGEDRADADKFAAVIADALLRPRKTAAGRDRRKQDQHVPVGHEGLGVAREGELVVRVDGRGDDVDILAAVDLTPSVGKLLCEQGADILGEFKADDRVDLHILEDLGELIGRFGSHDAARAHFGHADVIVDVRMARCKMTGIDRQLDAAIAFCGDRGMVDQHNAAS